MKQWPVFSCDSLPLPLPALHFAFEGDGGGLSWASAGAARAPIPTAAPTDRADSLCLSLSILQEPPCYCLSPSGDRLCPCADTDAVSRGEVADWRKTGLSASTAGR